MTTGRFSTANKVEVMNYIKGETDKTEEYYDKIRLLLIQIMCGNDFNEVK